MDSNTKPTKTKLLENLVQGYDFAIQLHHIISNPENSSLTSPQDLLPKILTSFRYTISLLDHSFEPISIEAASQNASCNENGKFDQDSVDSQKKLEPLRVKSKRGCYKRKKKLETWTVESTTVEDSYAWRKYGQKGILNAKFPRSYFRCTHKYTQGCKAAKQVQKLEFEHDMFHITYIGHHTCTINEETSIKIQPYDHHDEIIMDSEETVVKEEEVNNHKGDELSLVWQDLVFEENHYYHHQHGHDHESIYSRTSNDFMGFGAFNENELYQHIV